MSLLLLFSGSGATIAVSPAAARWLGVPVTASVGPISKAVLPAVAKWQGVTLTILRGGISKAVLPASAAWLARPITIGTGWTQAVLPAIARWTALGVGALVSSVAGRHARMRRR